VSADEPCRWIFTTADWLLLRSRSARRGYRDDHRKSIGDTFIADVEGWSAEKALISSRATSIGHYTRVLL
jgi:hypothetical protein